MDLATALSLARQLLHLRRQERWARPRLEAHQARSLRRLRAHTYAHSPFYQEFHRGSEDRPLDQLPVLTKATLMENFDDLVTDRRIHLDEVRAHAAAQSEGRLYRDRYWVNATSGSSGHPGLFLFEHNEWVTVLAAFARAREWAGLRINPFHRIKLGMVASPNPWHISAQVGQALRSWWVKPLLLPATAPLPEIVAQLNTWQPEILMSYASMIGLLADEQLQGRLCVSPRTIFSTSEVLSTGARQQAAQAWGQELFDQYATTETGALGVECLQGRNLHLLEDQVICEVVDECNRPVPRGTYGERLLVTVLFNYTQPLIRYELTDSICLQDESCPCGRAFSIVGGIQGREQDVLFLPGAAGGKVSVHPLIIKRALDLAPVSGWQVVQEAEGLCILLSGVRGASTVARVTGRLSEELVASGVRVPPIRVETVPAIPRGPGGKVRLIVAYRPPATATPQNPLPSP